MALLAKLDLVYHFADIAGVAIEALKQRERLVDRKLLGELCVLKLEKDSD